MLFSYFATVNRKESVKTGTEIILDKKGNFHLWVELAITLLLQGPSHPGIT